MKFQTIEQLAQELAVSTDEAQSLLKSGGLSLDDIDGLILDALKADLKGAIATEIKKSSAQITPTSQSLATQPIATNSSIKGGKLAPKKESAIAGIKKRGSSKVAKNQPIEKVQIEKASIKSNIQAGEVSVIEEAASAGYNSDVGTLAASAYLGGVQMRFADEVSANMPKAMGGMFDGIGKISDERHQGVFDHVRINQPHQEESTADEWSF